MLRSLRRLLIQEAKVAIRWDYLGVLNFGFKFKVERIKCQNCDLEFDFRSELARWYLTKDMTWSVKCPGCRMVAIFEPEQKVIKAGVFESTWYSPDRVLAVLRSRKNFSAEELFYAKEENVVGLALIYFGSLPAAFAAAGLQYPYSLQVPWKMRSLEFLGKMPDRQIASLAGVSRDQVFRHRRKMGISRAGAGKLLKWYELK